MVKISFVVVFSFVLALPLRSVLGQDGWQDLVGQGGFTGALDEAKKALDAANTVTSGQTGLSDYLGGDEGAGDAAAAGADAGGSSLADLVEADK